MLEILSRYQINANAWDDCVATSGQRIIYGYSWYLDAVLPAPSWKWVGLVLIDKTGHYQAVLPIPLRRKQLVGVTYEWVVHQPFFCQFLAIFSRDPTLDPMPFFQVMYQRFRYGSILCTHQLPDNAASFDTFERQTTHVIDLSVSYETLSQNYNHDRSVNLRRALRTNWTVIDSIDLEPLLSLFRENHADSIAGGVADWAYAIFRNLANELNQRGLLTLRYAVRNERIEAGALFVQEGNRIIYLFNAASETGRKGNARTLLIDQIIQENTGKSIIFDFESPQKASIRDFYRSFGAVEESFWALRWSRLNVIENIARKAVNALRSKE